MPFSTPFGRPRFSSLVALALVAAFLFAWRSECAPFDSQIILARSGPLELSEPEFLEGTFRVDRLFTTAVSSEGRGLLSTRNLTTLLLEDNYSPDAQASQAIAFSHNPDVLAYWDLCCFAQHSVIPALESIGSDLPIIAPQLASVDLREPFQRNVVNIRASQLDEVVALISYMTRELQISRIALIDSPIVLLGNEVNRTLSEFGRRVVFYAVHDEGSGFGYSAVPESLVSSLVAANPQGIIMGNSAGFIYSFLQYTRVELGIFLDTPIMMPSISTEGTPFNSDMNTSALTNELYITSDVPSWSYPTPPELNSTIIAMLNKDLELYAPDLLADLGYGPNANKTFNTFTITPGAIRRYVSIRWIAMMLGEMREDQLTRSGFLDYIYDNGLHRIAGQYIGPFLDDCSEELPIMWRCCNQGARSIFVQKAITQEEGSPAQFETVNQFYWTGCNALPSDGTIPFVFGLAADGLSLRPQADIRTGLRVGFDYSESIPFTEKRLLHLLAYDGVSFASELVEIDNVIALLGQASEEDAQYTATAYPSTPVFPAVASSVLPAAQFPNVINLLPDISAHVEALFSIPGVGGGANDGGMGPNGEFFYAVVYDPASFAADSILNTMSHLSSDEDDRVALITKDDLSSQSQPLPPIRPDFILVQSEDIDMVMSALNAAFQQYANIAGGIPRIMIAGCLFPEEVIMRTITDDIPTILDHVFFSFGLPFPSNTHFLDLSIIRDYNEVHDFNSSDAKLPTTTTRGVSLDDFPRWESNYGSFVGYYIGRAVASTMRFIPGLPTAEGMLNAIYTSRIIVEGDLATGTMRRCDDESGINGEDEECVPCNSGLRRVYVAQINPSRLDEVAAGSANPLAILEPSITYQWSTCTSESTDASSGGDSRFGLEDEDVINGVLLAFFVALFLCVWLLIMATTVGVLLLLSWGAYPRRKRTDKVTVKLTEPDYFSLAINDRHINLGAFASALEKASLEAMLVEQPSIHLFAQMVGRSDLAPPMMLALMEYVKDPLRTANQLLYVYQFKGKARELFATFIRAYFPSSFPERLVNEGCTMCKLFKSYSMLVGLPYLWHALIRNLMMLRDSCEGPQLEAFSGYFHAQPRQCIDYTATLNSDSLTRDNLGSLGLTLSVTEEVEAANLKAEDELILQIKSNAFSILSALTRTPFPPGLKMFFEVFYEQMTSMGIPLRITAGIAADLFFTRFVCPALTNPVRFGLFRVPPQRKTLSVLIHLSTFLENVVKRRTYPSHSKMFVMNNLIEQNYSHVINFVTNLMTGVLDPIVPYPQVKITEPMYHACLTALLCECLESRETLQINLHAVLSPKDFENTFTKYLQPLGLTTDGFSQMYNEDRLRRAKRDVGAALAQEVMIADRISLPSHQLAFSSTTDGRGGGGSDEEEEEEEEEEERAASTRRSGMDFPREDARGRERGSPGALSNGKKPESSSAAFAHWRKKAKGPRRKKSSSDEKLNLHRYSKVPKGGKTSSSEERKDSDASARQRSAAKYPERRKKPKRINKAKEKKQRV